MNFDIEQIKQLVTAASLAVGVIKNVRGWFPEGSKEELELSDALNQIERELKKAEAGTAVSLKYELCKAHWPPEIMLSTDGVNWECPVCGNKVYTGITTGTIRFSR